MLIAVRPLRADEGRIYLEIVNSAQHGVLLAAEQPARSLIEQFVAAR